jgi:hypothetical protein
MEKGLCLGSLAVAGILFVVFLLDLLIGMPFSGGASGSPFFLADIAGVIGSAILAYLALNAYKDVK